MMMQLSMIQISDFGFRITVSRKESTMKTSMAPPFTSVGFVATDANDAIDGGAIVKKGGVATKTSRAEVGPAVEGTPQGEVMAGAREKHINDSSLGKALGNCCDWCLMVRARASEMGIERRGIFGIETKLKRLRWCEKRLRRLKIISSRFREVK